MLLTIEFILKIKAIYHRELSIAAMIGGAHQAGRNRSSERPSWLGVERIDGALLEGRRNDILCLSPGEKFDTYSIEKFARKSSALFVLGQVPGLNERHRDVAAD
ncbi:hypothetical protein G5B40_15635 [Pikeienuella piscinae]|uniref:Uncharacterized protein n=1 Tax=Pikeienuella piscinae TaxID=2748098 RepID=A0A7L5C0V7_9RHOB|nr:hypothetical protein [Pikeienuella piscinae]QIE56738.1 hypothetical protein G5B40_15635 [Pikeienuella piscinae]